MGTRSEPIFPNLPFLPYLQREREEKVGAKVSEKIQFLKINSVFKGLLFQTGLGYLVEK